MIIYTPLGRYWITLYGYVLGFIVPHVNIQLADNKQFISNTPRKVVIIIIILIVGILIFNSRINFLLSQVELENILWSLGQESSSRNTWIQTTIVLVTAPLLRLLFGNWKTLSQYCNWLCVPPHVEIYPQKTSKSASTSTQSDQTLLAIKNATDLQQYITHTVKTVQTVGKHSWP